MRSNLYNIEHKAQQSPQLVSGTIIIDIIIILFHAVS